MLFESMIIAFSMYSKIPMPKIEWSQKNMKYAFCFFPLVGVVIGTIIYIVGNISLNLQMGKLLFSAIMTVIPVVVTGGIHVDGFLDTVDALNSWGDKEKKLEILKDPNAGAFAVIWGIIYFVVSFGLWSEVTSKVLPILAMGYVLSRTLSGLSMVSFPLAKNTGLAAAFQNGAHRKKCKVVMLIYLVIEIIVMLYLNPLIGGVNLLGCLGIFAYHYHVCNSQFGGITGDLAGYFLQNCELIILAITVLMGYM